MSYLICHKWKQGFEKNRHKVCSVGFTLVLGSADKKKSKTISSDQKNWNKDKNWLIRPNFKKVQPCVLSSQIKHDIYPGMHSFVGYFGMIEW